MVASEALLAVVLTSLFSAIGAVFLVISETDFEAINPSLLALAAGSMLGGAFIHLVFRLANRQQYTRITGLLVLAGLAGSMLLERAVHWHCHHRGSHERPTPYVLAVGDSIHNVLDGVLITTSFLASSSAGTAATVAVIAHKIPKEFGDFGVMVEGGFKRRKALLFNVSISLFMFLGAGAVLSLESFTGSAVGFLLPLVVGNFVYIAGSDLLPEIKEPENWSAQLLFFLLGVGFMYAITLI